MNPFLEVLYNSEPDTSIRVGADWWDFRESDAADSDAATSVTPELESVPSPHQSHGLSKPKLTAVASSSSME
jgi:hypothetical protein